MLDQGLITIIVTIITTLGGAKAWEYYQKKMELKRQDKLDEEQEKHLYRDDLRERVAVLEGKLEDNRSNRENLLVAISELKVSLAECKTRIEFLEKSLTDKEKELNKLRKENLKLKAIIEEKN